jgi:hypothetical protein
MLLGDRKFCITNAATLTASMQMSKTIIAFACDCLTGPFSGFAGMKGGWSP